MKRREKKLIAWIQILALAITPVMSGLPAMEVVAEEPQEIYADTLEENMDRVSDMEWDTREMDFNKNWRFFLEDGTSIKGEEKNFDDSGWRQLDLPHDYSIELDFDKNSPAGANGGYLNGGVGWYRKTFVLPESLKGKKISIDFGGVYMDSTTYVNGVMVGNYPYGYTPFAYDITNKLITDGVTENVIAVKVNHQQPSSRWYSGSGIYRNVDLVITDQVHVERYGTYVTTPNLEERVADQEAEVAIETKVKNDGKNSINAVIKSTIYDDLGNVFSETVGTDAKAIQAGEKVSFQQNLITGQPKLWGTDEPNLYELVTEVEVDGKVVDTYRTAFGFRWVEMDPNEGFYLNNEYMKLNGVCMHHDQGALGAVANRRAIERQMETMKAMGVNAIRVTHNPAADELIEICNKMGLMVIDEAFDCWESGKRSKDYGRFFNKPATHPDAKAGMTWAEFDIKQMVERGKNDPCIIMWSIGNEIVNASVGTAQNLVKWVGEVDPTRPATQGFNNFIDGFWDKNMKNVANVTGVVGFNYGEKSYDAAHKEYPDWIMMGTETSSAVRSRGFYKVDNEKKIRSCYDDGDTVGWGLAAEAAWKANRDRKFIMGEFMWTGYDYIGEPSPYHDQYPAKSSYFGTVDTAGIPKDAYYIYQSQWTTVEENPMVHMLPHWNWENDDSIMTDGKIAVQVYSNAANVELYLNGESLGKKDFYQRTTVDGRPYQEGEDEHIYLEWKVAYEPGELKAVARDMQGNIIAEDVIRTAGKPAKVKLTPDRKVITADGRDLSYILVEVLDSEGNVVPTADNLVKFQISGNGKIVGVDNGDATAVDQSYKGNERKAYSGKAMVIVQSTTDEGEISLLASSGGLNSDTVKVFTVEDWDGKERLLGYERSSDVFTAKGEMPILPETVMAIYSNGRQDEVRVSWDSIDEDLLKTPGMITIYGTVEGSSERVSIQVVVVDYIGIKPVHVVTGIGILPQMPEEVTVVSNTGAEKSLTVQWQDVSEDQVAEEGSFEVSGTVDGYEKEIIATVRVVAGTMSFEKDIAKREGKYPIPAASYVQPNGNDPVSAINNGKVVYSAGAAGERWIPWGHDVEQEWVQLELEKSHLIGKVGLDFWSNPSDTKMGMPDRVTISYSMDGSEWTEVSNQNISEGKDLKDREENLFTFDPVMAKYIRWNFYSEKKLAPGVSEVHIYEGEVKLESGTSADLSEIRIDEEILEGFSADSCDYTMDLAYGQELPVVTVDTEDPNATYFIVPALSKDGITTIQVIAEDGKTQKIYQIQFHAKLAGLQSAVLAVNNSEIVEDQVENLSLTAILEDGTVLSNSVLTASYQSSNPEVAEIRDGKLYALAVGTTVLKATVSYQGVTVESNALTINVSESTEDKIVTSYESITRITEKGKIPQLPKEIRATFQTGSTKRVKVEWEAITSEQCNNYGEFEVLGNVTGQKLQPFAKIIVRGVVGVQQFSGVTPVGVVPKLSDKARVYYTDNTVDELPVVWEDHPQSLFMEDGKTIQVKGKVAAGQSNDSLFDTSASIRVSSDTYLGDKFTGYKNGFYWPIGIASYTNTEGASGDSPEKLNDNIVSREPAGNNRWCNWSQEGRSEDWAGIIFGLEEVTNKFIDNLDIDFYVDHGSALPENYVIEYYAGETFHEPPAEAGQVTESHPTGVKENWKPVKNLQAPKILSETETNHFTFEPVETCAIRISMKAKQNKCFAITEMCAYEKLVTPNQTAEVKEILLDDRALEGFKKDTTSYTCDISGAHLPNVTAIPEANASVTVIQATKPGEAARVIVTAEDGVNSKTYRIIFKEAEKPLLIPVTGIHVAPEAVSLYPNESRVLAVSLKPENASNKTVSWSSANPSIAAVDQNGKVTAKACGKVAITASAKDGSGVKGTSIVSVVEREKPVIKTKKISLNMNKKSLAIGKKIKLKATLIPSNTTVKGVTFKTSNKKIATVDAKGMITAKGIGTADITVTSKDNQKKVTCKITVVPKKVTIGKLEKKSGTSMKVSWKKSKEVTGYKIYVSNKEKSGYRRKKTVTNQKTTSVVIKNMKKGKKYYVKVAAYKKKGSKTYLGEFSKIKPIRF